MLPRLGIASLGFAALLAAASCRSSSSTSAVDAAASARPKIVRPRVAAPGELPLDLGHSKLALTMIKDRVSPVTATLSFRDGAISLDGPGPAARLSVDLDSFDSAIAIRNERVRNLFFETSALGWESAELVLSPLPAATVEQLRKDKKVTNVALEADLKIHGHSSKLPLTVDAGYAEGGRIWVKSASSVPVTVKISDLGLTDNLHRLNAICMHDSIDDIVKIDASLEFSSSH